MVKRMLGELSLKLETVQRVTPRPVKHRAFTDLINWCGRYYLTFREATDHMSYDGSPVVMWSTDLQEWQRVEWSDDRDLRNGKFLDAGDRLFLYGAHRIAKGSGGHHVASIGTDGTLLRTEPISITSGSPWRPKRIGSKIWVATYRGTAPPEPDGHVDHEAWLECSDDGLNWQPVSLILRGQEATEVEILPDSDDGNLLAFIRRDGPRYPTLAMGVARPPFTEWQITETDKIIHAVAACHWQGRIIVVGRYMDQMFPNRFPNDEDTFDVSLGERLNRKICTKVWSWSAEGGFEDLLTLPSQGDCSYAGIVPEQDRLVISYYSQHELIAEDPDFSTLQGGAEVFVCTVRSC